VRESIAHEVLDELEMAEPIVVTTEVSRD
jgi:hypothetical protein